MNPINTLANDTVAVVLAGGKGTRLDPLTRHVCKPALPFGAAYRNIDFSLSNCVNSGIRRVGVATQHKPEALVRHIDRVWSGAVAGPEHFVSAWPGQERAPVLGYCGTADAVYRNLHAIEALDRRLVLILAGDHVYKMDYRPLLERHCESGAAITVGCVDVPIEDAHEFGVLAVDGTGRIDRFVEKPKTRAELPGGDRTHVLASMGIYVLEVGFLARVLRLDALSAESRHDFGADIVPRLVREAGAFAYPFRAPNGIRPAYWRDIGTIGAYWRAHMDLLGPSPRLRLDDAKWPLPTDGGVSTSTASGQVARGRRAAESSLVAVDCAVDGTVRRSVLFEGVEVRGGAEVADAVILPGAIVGSGCRLHGVVVASNCRIPDGMEIGQTGLRAAGGSRPQPVVVTAENVEELSARFRYAGQWPGPYRDGGAVASPRNESWSG